MSRGALFSMLVLAGASGCGAGEEAGKTGGVVVGVTSDFVVGGDIGSLEANVRVGGGAVSTTRWVVAGDRELAFPLELPFGGLEEGEAVEVELAAREGTSVDEKPFLRRAVGTAVVEGRTVLLRAHLEWECVPAYHLPGGELAPDCASPETCVAASCEDPFVPASELPDYRADWAVDYADECRPEDAGDPALTIGEGLDSFSPLAPGAPVLLNPGPQGGYHVWLALRSDNLHREGSVTTLSVTLDGAEEPLCDLELPWDFTPSEGGSCDLAGIQCVVANDIAAANTLSGQTATIHAKVRDLTGDVAFAQESFTFALPGQ